MSIKNVTWNSSSELHVPELPKVCSKWLQSIMHTVQFINTFTFRFKFIVQIRSFPFKLHVFSHRKRDWLHEQRKYVTHASCIHSPICCF